MKANSSFDSSHFINIFTVHLTLEEVHPDPGVIKQKALYQRLVVGFMLHPNPTSGRLSGRLFPLLKSLWLNS
jgi:hypothetical protein